MKLEVKTVITTEIDPETIELAHFVSIEAGPGVPESIASAAAVGACKSLIATLQPNADAEADTAPTGKTRTDLAIALYGRFNQNYVAEWEDLDDGARHEWYVEADAIIQHLGDRHATTRGCEEK